MPTVPELVRFVADRGDARRRLDVAVLRHLRDLSPVSRTRVQRWIADGRVRIDARVVRRASSGVPAGARVEIALPAEVAKRQPPAPEALPLHVLFQDDSLLVVNKPAGMVVHPTYKQTAGTLLNAVLAHVPARDTGPGIVTRLDKHTSGLVLVALAPSIHRLVQRDAAAGEVLKEYLAIVCGTPSPRRGEIRDALGRDPADRRRVTTAAGGASATTRYEVIASSDGRSLVRCELVTGRTHQIRAHMAARGWPLVGDATYGTRDAVLGDRQALHAWRLTLPHPCTRHPLRFEAPCPADLRSSAPTLFAGGLHA